MRRVICEYQTGLHTAWNLKHVLRFKLFIFLLLLFLFFHHHQPHQPVHGNVDKVEDWDVGEAGVNDQPGVTQGSALQQPDHGGGDHIHDDDDDNEEEKKGNGDNGGDIQIMIMKAGNFDFV